MTMVTVIDRPTLRVLAHPPQQTPPAIETCPCLRHADAREAQGIESEAVDWRGVKFSEALA